MTGNTGKRRGAATGSGEGGAGVAQATRSDAATTENREDTDAPTNLPKTLGRDNEGRFPYDLDADMARYG